MIDVTHLAFQHHTHHYRTLIMSFWEKLTGGLRSPMTPPPPSPSTPRGPSSSSIRSSSDTYIRRNDEYEYYNGATSSAPLANKYSRSRSIGDVYSRGGGDVENDRNELFSGYDPARSRSGPIFDGPDLGRDPTPGEENEEDVEGIKQQTRFVKQESVSSTRNALRLAREAEESARNTLTRLGDQSEKLSTIEHHLDLSKGHSQKAEDRTEELKQLNRSIFRPVVLFNKDEKRAAESAAVQRRYEDRREERMRTMRDHQERFGSPMRYGLGDDEELIDRRGSPRPSALGRGDRARYQFEKTASDDELEDELDENLDEIAAATKRLNILSKAMSKELEDQCEWVGRIEHKTTKLDDRISNNTESLKRIK
ncbi:unnamed protein product [Cyclocybe aegerita]|uniref:t-SNARE coiled-coil homology domain-containing protein n=1 Tax=Cyclocybe aegerita TaxID=1973307 RepID=A0A8S0X3N9_CYCAE|nr:unnamed protein product [Cyclocybe aegerita]